MSSPEPASTATRVVAAERAARRVTLMADRWFPLSAAASRCYAPISVKARSRGMATGLEHTLAKMQRAAARVGADRVIGFQIDIDPFGSEIEFNASGVAIAPSRSRRSERRDPRGAHQHDPYHHADRQLP